MHHLSTRHESFNQNLESARRSNKRGMWTLILVNTSDDIKKFFHAYSPMPADCELQRRLNQDRTAIYHNGLPGAESFLHQKQIGLRDFMSFADSANRETLSHAFV
jgi:hypothetical protein